MVMMMIISELQKLAFQKASSHLFHFGFGRLTQGEVAAFEKAEDGSKGVREEELGVKGVPGTGEAAVEESAKREERIEEDSVFRIQKMKTFQEIANQRRTEKFKHFLQPMPGTLRKAPNGLDF